MASNAAVLRHQAPPSSVRSCTTGSDGLRVESGVLPLQPEGLRRSVSDLSSQLSKSLELDQSKQQQQKPLHQQHGALPIIPEAATAEEGEEDAAKCECCGMSEPCTPSYIRSVKERFNGRWVCGLCAEAVNEELTKPAALTGGRKTIEDALAAHTAMCVSFNKFGRRLPVLAQAAAMKEVLKKRNASRRKAAGAGCILRSSSCMPAITREIEEGRRDASRWC